ncbi:MAG: branched-chain amino acid ABC transporter permease [Actinomycetia bacterium]|nr:branched-chain amino acid ABC transporter permease [Actinomycetes bacterium]
MNQFLQALINGLSTGGMLTLMVLGFSIIWGVMGVINFAHGEFIMVGAYMAWYANSEWDIEPLVAAGPIFVVMFVVGFVLQKILVNRVIDRPHLVSLLVMFAVSIIISNSVKLIFDADFRRVQSDIQKGFWSLGDGLTVPRKGTVVLVAALIILVTLQAFLTKTRLGKSIRAAAQNREAAQIVGIDIKWVYAFTFALCIGLTAVAGALTSPIIPIFPFMGAPWTLRAFVIAALSGLGSVKGALGGAMALGIMESMVATYTPGGIGSNMGVIVAFGLLVVTLVVRPQGLFDGLRPIDATKG